MSYEDYWKKINMFLLGRLNLEQESIDVQNLIRYHAASIIITTRHFGDGRVLLLSGSKFYTSAKSIGRQDASVTLEAIISKSGKFHWNDSSYIVNLIVDDENVARQIATESNSEVRRRDSKYSVPIFHEYFEPITDIFDN